MNLKILMLGTVLGLAACTQPVPKETRVVSEDQITMLMACLVGDKCNAPVETMPVVGDNDTMHMVTGEGTNGFVYRYFYTDNRHFGVVISSGNRVLLVKDDDLDGKVDHIGVSTGKPGESREAPISEADRNYAWTQGMYLHAMSLVTQVVPKELQEGVRKAPKV